MKIAHCLGSIDNPAAGTTYSVVRLTSAMRSLGLDAQLFTLGDPGDNGDADFIHRFEQHFADIPVVRRLGFSSGMRDALRDPSIDLFHSHGLWVLPTCYPAEAATRLDRPLMLSPHGMLGPAALRFSRGRKAMAWSLWQWKTLARVDCFRATCLEEWQEIRRAGLRQPTAIIPNGVDVPAVLPPRRTLPRKRVISIGRVHPKKGLDRLVRAWAAVCRDFPDWELEIIGPDEQGHAAELTDLATTVGAERVAVTGPRYGSDKLQALVDADLFALPTLNENFALTVAESLACGTPVISTKGAPWEGLETNHCGWWIDHGPAAMAAALRTAMGLSDAERRAMGLRGRQWMSSDYSWNTVGFTAQKVKQWLVGGSSPPPCVIFD